MNDDDSDDNDTDDHDEEDDDDAVANQLQPSNKHNEWIYWKQSGPSSLTKSIETSAPLFCVLAAQKVSEFITSPT